MVSPKQKAQKKPMTTGKKVAIGAVAAVGAAAVGYGAYKLGKKFFGGKKKGGRTTIARLRRKVLKTKLQTELVKSQRRLMKEQLKIA